jgi:hypothetical protein
MRLRCVAIWMLGVGLLCTSSTRALALPAPGAADVLVASSLTAQRGESEVGVIRGATQVAAMPARLPVHGVFRVPACAHWACDARRSHALARTSRAQRRPLRRSVTRRLRLPRANTTDDPDS